VLVHNVTNASGEASIKGTVNDNVSDGKLPEIRLAASLMVDR
jgi:hypothetical protein